MFASERKEISSNIQTTPIISIRMIFSTKIVTFNEKGTALIMVGLIGLLAVIASFFIEPLQDYAGYIVLASFAVVIIAVVSNQGDVSAYNLDKDFLVSDGRFEISGEIFPFTELADINIHFRSFKGMCRYKYEVDPDADLKETTGLYIYGVENFISFTYKKQILKYFFIVQDLQHFTQFIAMLEYLYLNQIDFSESNWHGKTFLLQNVSDEEFFKLKRKFMRLS